MTISGGQIRKYAKRECTRCGRLIAEGAGGKLRAHYVLGIIGRVPCWGEGT